MFYVSPRSYSRALIMGTPEISGLIRGPLVLQTPPRTLRGKDYSKVHHSNSDQGSV